MIGIGKLVLEESFREKQRTTRECTTTIVYTRLGLSDSRYCTSATDLEELILI